MRQASCSKLGSILNLTLYFAVIIPQNAIEGCGAKIFQVLFKGRTTLLVFPFSFVISFSSFPIFYRLTLPQILFISLLLIVLLG